MLALIKSGQWHFHQDNTPVPNSILVTNYLSKIGINTVPHPSYSPDLAPSNLRGCRYETIEEIKVFVTKVNDTLTQENFNGALKKLLERYKCILSGGGYFEEDSNFMCAQSIIVLIRKRLATYLRILVSCIILMSSISAIGLQARTRQESTR